jgi:hypothetical protein
VLAGWLSEGWKVGLNGS